MLARAEKTRSRSGAAVTAPRLQSFDETEALMEVRAGLGPPDAIASIEINE